MVKCDSRKKEGHTNDGAPLLFSSCNCLSEEEVCDGNSCEDACQIGKESASNSVACVADADRAKVYSQNVECGIGGSLENAG